MSDKRIPRAAIRDAWGDTSLSSAEAATKLGISRSTLWKRAKAMGLPDRPQGHPQRITGPEFDAMWLAGVLGADIAAHYRCHVMTVHCEAKRRGLPARPMGRRKVLRLSDYLAARRSDALALAMAAEAKRTRAAMRDAEMVDGRWVA